jgi:GNAT superfamily N-acetyltransferase
MKIIRPTIEQIAEMGLQIVSLISDYAKECAALDVNPEYIFNMLTTATISPDHYLAFAMDGGELVGYFLGAFHQELFTGKQTGNQYGFFMKQSHRHFIHKLIKSFVDYAKTRGCRKCYLHVGNYSPVERWSRVLQRSGFRPVETAFVKEF